MMSSNQRFSIYKSSAGSGKTHTLVAKYLSLILSQPDVHYFKHVLAITFTNKAVYEMKHRILATLEVFSGVQEPSGADKEMQASLCQELGWNDARFQKECAQRLQAILHSYSSFAVKTIDQFTYEIVRAFALDLKFPVGFESQLELDTLVDELTTKALERAEHDELMRTALEHIVLVNIRRGVQWSPQKVLKEAAKTSFQDESTQNLAALSDYSLADFLEIHTAWQEHLQGLEADLEAIGKQALVDMESNGLAINDFSRKASGIGAFFQKLSKREVKTPNSYVIKAFEEGMFFSKSSPHSNASFVALIEKWQGLYEPIKEKVEDYLVTQALLTTFFEVALFKSLRQLAVELREETGKVHISEFNREIKALIQNEPAPYIYERLGNQYNHYFIDEFQDTSYLQWRNLLPLVSEALSRGNESLVVGDAKQSIYRFRGGEMKQLVHLPELFPAPESSEERIIERQFKREARIETKTENFRSCNAIISFNNKFFKAVRETYTPISKQIYEDVEQTIGFPKSYEGYVSVEITSGEDVHEEQYDFVRRSILECVADGYRHSDICVLVRTKKEGKALAEQLVSEFPIVSSDALLLKASPWVSLFCAILSHYANPSSKLALVKVVLALRETQLLKTDLTEALLLAKEHTGPLETLLVKFMSMNLEGQPNPGLAVDVCYWWVTALGINPAESYYLSTFMDVLLDESPNSFSSCAEFLEYWEHNKEKLAIPINDAIGMPGVQILTAHKSKGLAFPVVIAPYQEGVKASRNTPHNWVKLDAEKYKLPVHYIGLSKSKLVDTPLLPYYDEEQERIKMDALNVLYVTCTRPKERLYIAIKPKRKELPEPFGVIASFDGYSEERRKLTVGKREKKTYANNDSGDQGLLYEKGYETTSSSPWSAQVKLVLDEEEPIRERVIGNEAHFVLSKMATSDTLYSALSRVEHRLDSTVFEEVKALLTSAFSHASFVDLFDQYTAVYRECEWKDAQGKIKKPDRVQVDADGNCTILDFKTGEEEVVHKKQLLEYKDALELAGYSVCKCVVVYLQPFKMLNVWSA